MSTKSDVKAERGTKRTCQHPECGSRFYDLNREPITCPICSSAYQIVAQPAVAVSARPAPKWKKPPFVPAEVKPEVPPGEVEAEELVAVEEDEEVAGQGDEEETFLEPDEESPNVTGIIDAPVGDTDEK